MAALIGRKIRFNIGCLAPALICISRDGLASLIPIMLRLDSRVRMIDLESAGR